MLPLAAPACSTKGALLSGDVYPRLMPRTEPSNIQLVRDGKRVRMTNTTARSFGTSRLWLNQWYAARIDGLPVAESVTLTLGDFRDEFGDPFRGGGFFAAEAPEKLVKAELETDLDGERVLIPLIVVGDTD